LQSCCLEGKREKRKKTLFYTMNKIRGGDFKGRKVKGKETRTVCSINKCEKEGKKRKKRRRKKREGTQSKKEKGFSFSCCKHHTHSLSYSGVDDS